MKNVHKKRPVKKELESKKNFEERDSSWKDYVINKKVKGLSFWDWLDVKLKEWVIR